MRASVRPPTSANSLVLCIMIKLWSFLLSHVTSASSHFCRSIRDAQADIASVDSPATLQDYQRHFLGVSYGTRTCPSRSEYQQQIEFQSSVPGNCNHLTPRLSNSSLSSHPAFHASGTRVGINQFPRLSLLPPP
jgi:hypothetical protein